MKVPPPMRVGIKPQRVALKPPRMKVTQTKEAKGVVEEELVLSLGNENPKKGITAKKKWEND